MVQVDESSQSMPVGCTACTIYVFFSFQKNLPSYTLTGFSLTPIAPIFSVAGGDDTTIPRRQGPKLIVMGDRGFDLFVYGF
jgi:hypothetical protein